MNSVGYFRRLEEDYKSYGVVIPMNIIGSVSDNLLIWKGPMNTLNFTSVDTFNYEFNHQNSDYRVNEEDIICKVNDDFSISNVFEIVLNDKDYETKLSELIHLFSLLELETNSEKQTNSLKLEKKI